MSDFGADDIRKAALTPRWAALSQLGGIADDLHNYDRFLVREPRLLVPVDVQALVVRAGANDTEPMLALPFRDGKAELPPVKLDDPGTPRPPGVHLLWTVPAALGRGTVVDDPLAPGDPTRRRLQLPVLPDRWTVLRLAVPSGAAAPLVAGWVIEADAGTVTPLADWPTVMTNTTQVGPPIALHLLNVHSGGTGWTQCYDAAQGRFALHDPLTDLAGVALEGDAVSYLVAGWWSQSADDPLDGVGTDAGYRQRLAQLGWNDPDHPSTDASRREDADKRYRAAATRRSAIRSRCGRPRPPAPRPPRPPARARSPRRPTSCARRSAASSPTSSPARCCRPRRRARRCSTAACTACPSPGRRTPTAARSATRCASSSGRPRPTSPRQSRRRARGWATATPMRSAPPSACSPPSPAV
jgi:hypothetical protein